jgi:hypothetical protein
MFSKREENLEATPKQSLAVERHILRIHLQARVTHHGRIDAITILSRLVDDPGEHHDFVRLKLHRLRKRCDLARLHIVGDAFDVFKSAVLFPDRAGFRGKLLVGVDVLGWNGKNEPVLVFVGHHHISSLLVLLTR